MKNKILENVKIEKIGYGWVWLATLENGKKVIIKGGMILNSIVDCRILKSKKDYIETQLLNIKSIPKNVILNEDMCPHYLFDGKNMDICHDKWCGWCKWQIMDYKHQIDIKSKIAEDSFRYIKDKLWDVKFYDILESPNIFGYRNKIEFSFWNYIFGKDHKVLSEWSLGFNKQWDFRKVIDVNNCKLISDKMNEVYIYLKTIFSRSKISVYDKIIFKGLLRHLVIREWVNTDQILVNLVVNCNKSQVVNLSDTQNHINDLIDIMKKDTYLNNHVNTMVVTHNTWVADVVKWKDIETTIIWWDSYIFEELRFSQWEFSDVIARFRISPFSFFQTNTMWAQMLFKKASELVWTIEWDILDLYCGAWAIWIVFKKLWFWDGLIGIDIVEDAIEDAKFNAQINWLNEDVYFVAWKAENLIFHDKKVHDRLDKIWLIIVDPPREWLHPNVLKFLSEISSYTKFKLLYISCNPITMSRDISILLDWWFKLKYVQPVDLFPHTHHMEMISVLKSPY